jgi:hypothetical protein
MMSEGSCAGFISMFSLRIEKVWVFLKRDFCSYFLALSKPSGVLKVTKADTGILKVSVSVFLRSEIILSNLSMFFHL